MKIALFVILSILAIYLVVSAWATINHMEVPRRPIEGSPASVGLIYEDVSFPSRDGITLRGWYIPGGDFGIILVHGRYRGRTDPSMDSLGLTRDLAHRGYSLLLFDRRGRGESDGKGILFRDFEQDVGGAIDYIRNRGCQDVGIIGTSLGAAESLMFIRGEPITAIVSDSAYAILRVAVVKGAPVMEGYPSFLAQAFWPGMVLMARIIYGYKVVNPVEVVGDISYPVLFIHGESDSFVPPAHARMLYEASTNPNNELWVVAGADHCQAYKTDPASYIDKVTSFFGGE